MRVQQIRDNAYVFYFSGDFKIHFDRYEAYDAIQKHIHMFFGERGIPVAILKGQAADNVYKLIQAAELEYEQENNPKH